MEGYGGVSIRMVICDVFAWVGGALPGWGGGGTFLAWVVLVALGIAEMAVGRI